MEWRFEPVAFDDIRGAVRAHLAALPGTIDSYLEEHILASTHYRIVVADELAGFASIHGEKLITQFALAAPYRRHGQGLFGRLRRLEAVQSAFVPTCDEFFVAHALDDYRQLAKQAYFFAVAPDNRPAARESHTLRPAEPGDIALIERESSDFFAPIERSIADRALFVTLRHGEPVGFGVLVESALYAAVGSIGMYTIARFRRGGVGATTIALLIAECERRGLRAVAGCWYYNHRSKQTLERAGLYAPTRLLKIDY